MVNYICQTCNKRFNKKSNFIYHTQNRKNSCKLNNIFIPNIPNYSEAIPKNSEKIKNDSDYKSDETEQNKKSW